MARISGPVALEICAGGGGQALGLESAGFSHCAAVEIDQDACITLKRNRPEWDVIQADVLEFDGRPYRGVDLLAGGVPCPPFSIAGKQLGHRDERDLFPAALRLVSEIMPRAVMLENVRGFATAKFDSYRTQIQAELDALGYETSWRVLNASDFGVPQLRPRFVLVALRPDDASHFQWPEGAQSQHTVAEAIGDLMASNGWPGTEDWMKRANGIAPTIVGGSRKHGGPDLGPTRARMAWDQLGVDAIAIAAVPPDSSFPIDGKPRLTVRMVARIQGFSDDWDFAGTKTSAYRQVGNAFPPPVARAVGEAIRRTIQAEALFTRQEALKPRQLELVEATLAS